jgi:signal transduction histidine kinase
MIKKTKYIFYFLLLISQHCFSQSRSVYQFLKAIDWVKSDSIAMCSLDSISKKELTPKQILEVNIRILTRANFMQQFNKAVTIANSSIFLAQKNDLDSMEAAFNEQLGNSYYYMDNRPKAINQYKRGIEIAEKHGDWEVETACYNNMAAATIDLKDYKNGEIYLLKTINLMLSHGKENDPNTQRTQRMLATLYTKTNRIKEAEKIYLDFIEKGRKNKDTVLLCNNLIFYSSLLFEKHDSIKAVEVSAEAMKYLRKDSDFHSLLSGMNFHSRNLASVGRTKEAYNLMVEANSILKKSFANDLNKQISEAEVKYKTEQIKYEKELGEIKAKKKQQIYLFSFVAIFLSLIISFYIFIQRKNTKQKIAFHQQKLTSLIEGEEKERSRIAKDLHDGIVQDLTAIKLKVQDHTHGNKFLESISKDIDLASKEVRNIAYQMMPVALREYGLISALEDLLQKTLTKKNIKFDFEPVNLNDRLPEKIEVCLYRITQELLNNVIKHSQASFVSLIISKHQDYITLIFEDNGTGFDQNDVKKGIGMNSLSSRLEIVNGELKFETTSGNGTMAIVKVPL